MPEICQDADILLATSYKSLNNLSISGKNEILDQLVILAFVCFYFEASVNAIILKSGKIAEYYRYFNIKEPFESYKEPGLHKKFCWLYYKQIKNECLGKNWNEKVIELDNVFPGYQDIYLFRNDIAHGRINSLVYNSEKVLCLRKKTKNFVNKLIKFTKLDKIDREKFIPDISLYSSSDYVD